MEIYIENTNTIKMGNFIGFVEVFWIFLKNEHVKLKFTPNWAV